MGYIDKKKFGAKGQIITCKCWMQGPLAYFFIKVELQFQDFVNLEEHENKKK
ncbi:MAG: hypothetical protein ACTSYF_04590 [Promethearchaeota archaeon]